MRRHVWAIAILMFVVLALVFATPGCEKKTTVVETEPNSTATQPATSPKSPPVNKQATLYFLKGETPTAVTRSVLVGKDKTIARIALEELLKGPTGTEQQQGLTTAIPEGTRLESYGAEGHEANARGATADFSKELKNFGGGSARVQTITDQVTKTVKANDPGVKDVEIRVEGVPAEESLQP